MDQQFCNQLELIISNFLQHTIDHNTKGFWCDGVTRSEPDSHYSKQIVNRTKQVKLKAFIGRDGQSEFELTLIFGPQSLSRYARDLDITECLPEADQPDSFSIDINRCVAAILLA